MVETKKIHSHATKHIQDTLKRKKESCNCHHVNEVTTLKTECYGYLY